MTRSTNKSILIISLAISTLLSACQLSPQPVDAAPAPVVVESNSLPVQTQKGKVNEFGNLFAGWSDTAPDYQINATPQTLPPAENPNYIYLTFDDGPDPKWTPQIVSLLSKHNATGTFFVIGRNAVSFPDLLLLEAQAGQMIANHGFNHISLPSLDFANFTLEVKDTEYAVREALAAYPALSSQVVPCIRPPYGDLSPNVWTFASRLPYNVSMWTLDTKDWTGLPAESILDNVLTNVKPGSVILMHDGGNDRTETVKALGLVLHELTLQGWVFRPMCTAEGQQAPAW